MVTQTIHVGDCELLEHYMDDTDGSNPKWQNWDNREWLEGLNAHADSAEPLPRRRARQQRVREGLARAHAAGAEPALVPVSFSGLDRMNPAEMVKVHWTHWEDLRNVYGVGAGRLRAQDVRQRRRPVRAEGADGRQHHAGGVPEGERHGRQLEGAEGHGPGGLPVPVAAAADAAGATGVRPVERGAT